MPDICQFEVDFNTYCKLCKHKDVLETDDPCNECLDHGWRKFEKILRNMAMIDYKEEHK